MALRHIVRNTSQLNAKDSLKKAPSTVVNPFRLETIKSDQWELYFPTIEQHFIPFEPIGLGLNSTLEDTRNFLREGVKEWSNFGVSVVAFHTPTNEIAGVNFNNILTKEQSTTFKQIEIINEQESEKLRITRSLLSQLEVSVNLFADPGVTKVLEIAVVAVDKKFSGNRLAQRLVREGINLGMAQGCNAVTGQATNRITAIICERVGLAERFSMDYDSFRYKGKKVLNVAAMGKDNDCAKVYFGRIPQDLKL